MIELFECQALPDEIIVAWHCSAINQWAADHVAG
jgi:hypothetical protein